MKTQKKINKQKLTLQMVVEARLVSSCFSWPSRARPRLSRLSPRLGVIRKTRHKVDEGGTFVSYKNESTELFVLLSSKNYFDSLKNKKKIQKEKKYFKVSSFLMKNMRRNYFLTCSTAATWHLYCAELYKHISAN